MADRGHVLERVRQLLNDEEVEPSPLLRTLATLPFKIIVTTNYDSLLERALDQAGRDCFVVSQPSAGFSREDQVELQEALASAFALGDVVVVYKLHGSFGSSPLDLVLDEDDYINLMGAFQEGVPRMLLRELVASTHLCVGYSVRDWDFRMMISQLPRHVTRKMFAVLRDPSSFWIDYLKSRDYHVVDAHVYDFGDELAERWAARCPHDTA